MSDFTHLHLHTEYSLLDGLPKIKDLVTAAKHHGFNSLAVTDHGVLHGAVEFYQACREVDIKPIIGLEAYVSKSDHSKKEKSGPYRDSNHLILLAKDETGYRNLMKLTTIAHLEGFYYKPRFDKKTLEKHKQGLICLSACLQGEISEYLSADDFDKAKQAASWYAKVFGPDNYYLELQRHQYADHADDAPDNTLATQMRDLQVKEDKVNQGLVKLSKALGIPLVATNDVHYLKQADARAQDALVCIQTGKQVADTNRLRYVDTPTFFLKSSQEMADLFQDQPAAISNTQKIAKACNLEITLGQWYFPRFNIPGGQTAGQYLKQQALKGVKKLYPKITRQVKDRLEFELDVIEKRGYSPYFLIVADMVDFCRGQGIVTTTRGSAAGSLVLYATGITEVDPLKYQLPFERFLNPYRPSPPDIDLDIADNRRGDLIAYITQKYGADKVAQICTFGRMLARASVRDIGRVLGFPYSFADKLAKAVPLGSQGFPMTIKKALGISDELKEFYNTNADAKQLLDLAVRIEGNARHTSVHAAGLVISPETITDYSPLQRESGGEKAITQYEMHSCEDVGLIKFDILGIRNLAILNSAIDIIRDTTGKSIDIKTIPLDDKLTYTMLSKGETMGVFQLGGSGMTRYLVDLKPERVQDLMAMVALFRPGPMANIPEYIKRKNDPKRVKYMHPKMESFLKSSYGILVYQEDVLFTAIELAGYNWESVDKLRKAVGKKIPSEMKKQEKIFIDGCINHSGMSRKQAGELWALFVPFQGYGFNKAHAAAYGIVAYQTAYLKAHYPVEYMTAVLKAEAEYTDKVVEAINECKRMQIPVLPPDINSSGENFTIVSDKKSKHGRAIRFGLSAIKNVGVAAVEAIVSVREKHQRFNSFTQFLSLIDSRKVNKKVLESLIKVGAMDEFGSRAALLAALDDLRNTASSNHQKALTGQDSLFDVGHDKKSAVQVDKLPAVDEFPKAELLSFEKQLLGLYLTEHPMADALAQISQEASHKLSDLDPSLHAGKKVTLGGIIASLRPILTKKSGKEMAFAQLEDDTGSIDVVFFPNVWETLKSSITTDQPVLISGKLDTRDDQLNLIAEKVQSVGDQASQDDQPSTDFSLTIPSGTDKHLLQKIGATLKQNPGKSTLSIVMRHGDNQKTLKLPYTVNYNQNVQAKIASLLRSHT